MTRHLFCLFILSLCAGCSIPRPHQVFPAPCSVCVGDGPCTTQILEPHGIVPSPSQAPCCPQQKLYTSDTINTRQQTIEASAIKRQLVFGTNAVLLRDAIVS